MTILSFSVKTLLVLFLLVMAKAVLGRIRIDQMVAFCWKFLVPAAVVQFFVIIIMNMLVFK